MCVKDMDVCDCSCHSGFGGGVHCMPCCQECPRCKARIRMGFYDQHVKACEAMGTLLAQRLGEALALYERDLRFHGADCDDAAPHTSRGGKWV